MHVSATLVASMVGGKIPKRLASSSRTSEQKTRFCQSNPLKRFRGSLGCFHLVSQVLLINRNSADFTLPIAEVACRINQLRATQFVEDSSKYIFFTRIF